MASNRGGGRGSGHRSQGGHGLKRKPNSLVGGTYKDLRRDLNSNKMDYYDEEKQDGRRFSTTEGVPRACSKHRIKAVRINPPTRVNRAIRIIKTDHYLRAQ